MILYIAGPMSGLPDNNRLAFLQAEDRLRAAGYSLIVNPARNGLMPDAPWIAHMRADISNLVSTCDAVVTLPGVESSRGGAIETALARALDWPVKTLEEWIEMATTERNLRKKTADRSIKDAITT